MPLPLVWMLASLIPLWCAGAVLRSSEGTGDVLLRAAKAKRNTPGPDDD
jgi:hypothetical protein